MTKIRRLQHEALKSCRFRGHDMKRFCHLMHSFHYAYCRHCGMGVSVDTDPLPDGAEIMGEAVALNCER